MALVSYFDFAENDYNYFMNSVNHGLVANMMASIAQNICEKYMKHLINEFYFNTRYPGDESFEVDKEDIEDCVKAVRICRKETIDLIKYLEQEKYKGKTIDEKIVYGTEVCQQSKGSKGLKNQQFEKE